MSGHTSTLLPYLQLFLGCISQFFGSVVVVQQVPPLNQMFNQGCIVFDFGLPQSTVDISRRGVLSSKQGSGEDLCSVDDTSFR